MSLEKLQKRYFNLFKLTQAAICVELKQPEDPVKLLQVRLAKGEITPKKYIKQA
jgi:hypothetical protein